MNPKFEKDVLNNTIIPEQPKVPEPVLPKPVRPNQRLLKYSLLTFIVLAMFIGVLLIIRGVISSTIGLPQDVQNQNTKPKKDLTEIPPFDISDSGNQNKGIKFYTSTSAGFTNYDNTKVYLVARNSRNALLGYVKTNEDFKFESMFVLPPDSKNITIVEGNNIYFTTTDDKFQNSLIAVINDTPYKIKTYSNQTIVSIYYSIKELLFYALVRDKNDFFSLQTINWAGESSQVFSSNFLTNNAKLLSEDNDVAYFQQDQKCYRLDFNNKKLADFDCFSITRNSIGQVFWTNSSGSNQYVTPISGEVYTATLTAPNRTVLGNLGEGKVAGSLFYASDYLYFPIYKLEKEGTIYNTVLEKVVKLDPSSLQRSDVQTGLKEEHAIQNAFQVKDKLYVIIAKPNATSGLYVYNPKTISYPVSFPGSQEWEEIPLNATLVEAIQQEFYW